MKRNSFRSILILLCMSLGNSSILAKEVSTNQDKSSYNLIKDLEYATVNKHKLLLDLYIPKKIKKPPLVVWVHGGAWRKGSKSKMPLKPLVTLGFAIASIDYRLSTVAPFPALIHDCKAAIRWLRANEKKYKFNAKSIGIAGSSAGGHIVALIGTSNDDKILEGNVGDHLDQSSSVQAIVDFFGASNLRTILKQSTPHGLNVREPALKLLLGGSPDEKPDLARLASPVFHVDPKDPPLLLFHGDQDLQMPINQAHELHGVYKANSCVVTFRVLYGAAHGGKEFYNDTQIKIVQKFLKEHLE